MVFDVIWAFAACAIPFMTIWNILVHIIYTYIHTIYINLIFITLAWNISINLYLELFSISGCTFEETLSAQSTNCYWARRSTNSNRNKWYCWYRSCHFYYIYIAAANFRSTTTQKPLTLSSAKSLIFKRFERLSTRELGASYIWVVTRITSSTALLVGVVTFIWILENPYNMDTN